ncbi:MAG: ATP-binding protein [Flavobacteriaceae bacterium]|nr:ATP-binding protein [Flavobacteriaceae bacterium]
MDLDITESSEISEVFKVVMDKIISLNIEDRDRLKHNVKKSYIALDQKSLSFVLYELIDNALKFSENKIVKISGSKYKNNHYEIIITDTGVGFSQLELKNIKAGIQFNREKQEQQGLGLGLYLSKKIVKNSNGVLSIVSKENSGTQISIFLPLYKEAKKKLTNLI